MDSPAPETTVAQLFNAANVPIPRVLADWERQVDEWCADYRGQSTGAEIVEVRLGLSVYVFDLTEGRVVVPYGIAAVQQRRRDSSRMRGFPDVNVGVQHVLGERAFKADKGHFLGHASGGDL